MNDATARFTLSLVAGLILALAPLATARADDALERMVDGHTFDQFVTETLRLYDVPGAVVAVASADGTVFLKGYGKRGPAGVGAVDPDTRFQIASLSKFIAATAIATLVDRGTVSWDAPVRTFSPQTVLGVPYASDNATLRDFLAHRTGLPAYGGDLLIKLGYSTDEIVARARFLTADHSFRSHWAYSNFGIFLGQHAASSAASTTPKDLLEQAILLPLGMTRSGPLQATLFGDDNRAVPVNFDGSAMPYDKVDAFSGAGAVVSTGADIARWMRMLLARGMFEGRQVLSPKSVDEIFAASMVQGTGGPLHDPNDSAGLGCESYHFLRYRVIEKNGALNGMRTIVTLIPERGLGIAIFANKQLTVFPEAIRAEFLERALGPSGRDLQKEIRDQQPLWRAIIDAPVPPSGALPAAHDVQAYVGQYFSDLYGAFDVALRNGKLEVAIGPNAYKGHFAAWSGDTFLLTLVDADVAPGLLTFKFTAGVANATGLEGSSGAGPDYGFFARTNSPGDLR